MTVSLARLPKSLLLTLLACASCYPGVSALHGDSWCGTLMCVSATVNSSTVTYEMKSLNQLGWMAVYVVEDRPQGFGTQMANTPLVIMWRNPDGSVSLSQRQATGLVEPVPMASPARRAVLSSSSSTTTSPSDSPILAFDIPADNQTAQMLIWAFGVTTPDADPASSIEQHLDAGRFSLDLAKTLEDDPSPLTSASSPVGATQPIGSTQVPTAGAAPRPTSSQSSSPPPAPTHTSGLLVAHASFSAAGFLIFLPLGTLVARWTRVLTPRWFSAHWFINVVLGIPAVCVGWALGPLAVAQEGKAHVITVHQIGGVVLFALYITEVALGMVVHLRRKAANPHPPRNIVHVVLGLAIFGLSIFEVSALASTR
ncbi:hypothetical protein OH77DRAFT_1388365 [Trametes cingulata]|nr:hypothetical protein OH77DRAFT_1388365 [Trametes cingulata]